MEYSASGLMGPGPMEAASADLTAAQADMVRAQARAMEAHPEFFFGGWRGYGGYYGYGGYGRVDPSYYYPSYSRPASMPVLDLEERARGLEDQATDFERRLDVLEGRRP